MVASRHGVARFVNQRLPARAVLAALVAALCVGAPFAAPALAADDEHARAITRTPEPTALRTARGRATLIDLHPGSPNQLTVLAVHGFRGQPSDLAPLIAHAIEADQAVKAFTYDDTFRSLEDSSVDLASAIERWAEGHPGAALRIDAHSMGGRVVLGALARLSTTSALTGPLQVNLIAVPLAGIGSANCMRFFPRFLPWVRPLLGLAPRSRYQRLIDRLELPAHVEVNVYAGGKDGVFRHATARYRAIVRRLRGRMHVFPDATHVSTIAEVARLPPPPVVAYATDGLFDRLAWSVATPAR